MRKVETKATRDLFAIARNKDRFKGVVRTCCCFLIASALAGQSLNGQTVISDAVGDALGHADAIAISGGVARSNLYLTATFQNGTLNRTNLGFMFGLDTDRNPNTGTGPPASFPLGAEFTLFYASTLDTNSVTVSDNTNLLLAGLAPVTFGSNTLSLTLPLSMLRSSNGVMNFGFICGVPVGTNGSFQAFDTVPNTAAGGPLGGPTSVIPELRIAPQGTNRVIRWTTAVTNYVLQAATRLGHTNQWTAMTNAVRIVNTENTVVDTATNKMRFYRLKK